MRLRGLDPGEYPQANCRRRGIGDERTRGAPNQLAASPLLRLIGLGTVRRRIPSPRSVGREDDLDGADRWTMRAERDGRPVCRLTRKRARNVKSEKKYGKIKNRYERQWYMRSYPGPGQRYWMDCFWKYASHSNPKGVAGLDKGHGKRKERSSRGGNVVHTPPIHPTLGGWLGLCLLREVPLDPAVWIWKSGDQESIAIPPSVTSIRRVGLVNPGSL